jgi:hypothetical protein
LRKLIFYVTKTTSLLQSDDDLGEPDENMLSLLKDLGSDAETSSLLQKTVVKKRSQHKRFKTSEDFFKNTMTSKGGHVAQRSFRDSQRHSRDPVPVWKMTSELSEQLHPNAPHLWLCDGRLLVLTDPTNDANLKLFQVSE